MALSDSRADVHVELRGARLPWIGWLAHHYWLVIEEGAATERWEVWQRRNRATTCNGHLHRDLLPLRAGVGAGDSWLLAQWRGAPARQLATRARESLETYPWCDRYRFFPGPNSNTYVQWLLQDHYRLPWPALGRNYIVAA